MKIDKDRAISHLFYKKLTLLLWFCGKKLLRRILGFITYKKKLLTTTVIITCQKKNAYETLTPRLLGVSLLPVPFYVQHINFCIPWVTKPQMSSITTCQGTTLFIVNISSTCLLPIEKIIQWKPCSLAFCITSSITSYKKRPTQLHLATKGNTHSPQKMKNLQLLHTLHVNTISCHRTTLWQLYF